MTKTVQCAICLDYHLRGSHCHSCGALLIGCTHYQITTGRVMARAIPRPLHQTIDDVITYVQSLPEVSK